MGLLKKWKFLNFFLLSVGIHFSLLVLSYFWQHKTTPYVLAVDRLGSATANDGKEALSQRHSSRLTTEINPKPSYPPLARRLKLSGTAIVEIKVSSNGEITEIKFQKSTGYELLDNSIIETLKKWKIPNPQKRDFWFTLPEFVFKLKKNPHT